MLNERDTSSQFQPLPLVEQAHLAEKHGLETLVLATCDIRRLGEAFENTPFHR